MFFEVIKLSEEKRVQFDNKERRKQERGEWIDKNWQYILEGWAIIFILLLITFGIYSVNLEGKNWNSSFFLNAVIVIGAIMFMIMAIGFDILMIFSTNEMDFLYFCSFLGQDCFFLIATMISKYWFFLVGSIFSSIVIGCFYSILRSNRVIEDKSIKISLNNIKVVLTIIVPALTPIIASLIKK